MIQALTFSGKQPLVHKENWSFYWNFKRVVSEWDPVGTPCQTQAKEKEVRFNCGVHHSNSSSTSGPQAAQKASEQKKIVIQ